MYKEITLKCTNGEDKIFKFLASGTTIYRYQQIFHEDLMKKLQVMKEDADYSIIDKLAYIMNAQAEGKDIKTLNLDTFYTWLEQFESYELLTHGEDIIKIYIGSKFSSSIPKKK